MAKNQHPYKNGGYKLTLNAFETHPHLHPETWECTPHLHLYGAPTKNQFTAAEISLKKYFLHQWVKFRYEV